MEWKKVAVNKQNIETETARAMLFNCPHKSKYDGYSFWHPAKLVRRGSNSYELYISFTDDFDFVLKKHGKGQYNKEEVIDEKHISPTEFEEMFGGIVT